MATVSSANATDHMRQIMSRRENCWEVPLESVFQRMDTERGLHDGLEC